MLLIIRAVNSFRLLLLLRSGQKEQIVMRKREEQQWPTCSERIAQ
jgi:hypothetical protein